MSQFIFKNKKTQVLITQQKNHSSLRQIALKGDDGVGVSSIYVSPINELIITYTDGRTQNAGIIQDQDPSVPVAIQDDFIALQDQQNFTLSNNATQIAIVTINGIQQKHITDYTITDNNLSFTYPLEQDDIVIITYSIPLASISTYDKKFIATNNTPNNPNTGIIALQLSNNESLSFDGQVILKDISNTSIANFRISGCVCNFNNTIEFVGTPQIVLIGKNNQAQYNGYDLFLDVNNTSKSLEIKTLYTGGTAVKVTSILNLLQV